MIWASEPPTEPGWWWLHLDGRAIEIARVVHSPITGELTILTPDRTSAVPHLVGTLWSGPILLPREATAPGQPADLRALLVAALDSPGEDTPLCMIADWVQEHVVRVEKEETPLERYERVSRENQRQWNEETNRIQRARATCPHPKTEYHSDVYESGYTCIICGASV